MIGEFDEHTVVRLAGRDTRRPWQFLQP
jgi:hypothetical protein